MYLLLLFCGLIVGIQSNDSKLINLSQGPVLGYRANDADVFEFYGIPYATAPTGRDRFKGPLPAPVWTETLEAVEDIYCPQFSEQSNVIGKNIKEDCLVANVFVPDTNETNLPVMVWVHGGAFQRGHSTSDIPNQMVDSKRFVAVSFNYRVGPLGFLCLGTEEAPGNAGMKDQVALLRWVQANIKEFGGNPDDVTISGCSAGGVSVDLLLLSKMAKGLFHRAIATSGANIATFGIQVDPIENALKFARLFDYDGNDINSLVEFYLNTPLEELNKTLSSSSEGIAVGFSPCVELDLGGEVFLDDSPVNILKKGDYSQCSLLYGYANMEGLNRHISYEILEEMNANFEKFLPEDLAFETEEKRIEVAQKVKELYFGDKPISNETSLGYVEYYTDVMFVYAMQRSVTLQVQSGNNQIYLFVYSFVDENSQYVPNTNIQGATHCSEIFAAMDEDESKITAEYKIMKQKMQEVWVDFITTGNPTPPGSSLPTWPPAGEDRSPCMDFGNTIQLAGPFEERRTRFWDDIYDQYLRQPVPPYRF